MASNRASRVTALADRAPSPTDGNVFLASLHTEHREQLLRFTRRLLPTDPHRAEDVVQECLFRAWRNSETLAEKGSVRAWLFTVARNLIVDWSRRDNARPVVFGDDDFDLLPGGTDFADEVVERCVVEEGLAQLTPMQREALEQVYRYDRTRQRAAVSIGVPVGTVKSRVHHARIAMTEVLACSGVTAAGW